MGRADCCARGVFRVPYRARAASSPAPFRGAAWQKNVHCPLFSDLACNPFLADRSSGPRPPCETMGLRTVAALTPNIAMPVACLLIAFGVAAPSPFSIAGRDGYSFDPERPGIAGVTRHPLLWAITLWAAAHTVPNGDLAHVTLFGLFAVFGIAGMVMLDARKRREWGQDLWA